MGRIDAAAGGTVYDRIGLTYSQYRRADPRVGARIERALGDAGRVLDVGAGTGSYETGRRAYVAVEPSTVMIGQRPPGAAPVVQAGAGALPFADGAFDGAMAVFTVHHWPDYEEGLREVRRVTTGPVVVLTQDVAAFDQLFWLVREYLPPLGPDAQPMPDVADIARVLGPCRVEVVPVPYDCTDGFFAAYWRRPEMYLDPDARAAISGLALMDDATRSEMVACLRADLESGEWHRRHANLLELDEYDNGYRLVVSESG